MANLKQVQGGVHINNNLTYTPGSSYIFSIDCDSSSSYAMLVDENKNVWIPKLKNYATQDQVNILANDLNDLENQAYATTASLGSGENSSNSGSNSTNKVDNDTVNKNKTHTFGSNGKLPIDVMIKIQQGILNIDESIIKELQPLFFGLY